MKTISKLITGTFVLLSFATASQAQAVSATATATATIVAPLTITETSMMNFGNVSPGVAGGTVILSPEAVAIRTATGDVQLSIGTPGTVTAAAFDVTGTANYTYAITLPPDGLVLTSGSNTMTVSTFTSTPTTTGLLTGGAQTIYVGGTLNVGAAQAVGVYVSGTPFTVTVNYN